jgi:hypothetical protein
MRFVGAIGDLAGGREELSCPGRRVRVRHGGLRASMARACALAIDLIDRAHLLPG